LDIKIWLEGMREIFKLANKMQQLGREVYIDDYMCKPCQKTKNIFDSPCDEYLLCLTKQYGMDGHHFAGTCRMGSNNDDQAVVDERLRVRKVSGLRVIDASIIPRLASGGTYATSLMIGEYGAQMVIEDSVRHI
jgi:choline dehydrogenase-like flavoprotein